MDRYKFRGKPEDVEFIESECFFPEEFYKDGFVYGQLVSDNIIAYGVVNAEDDFITFEYWARVDQSTVGQYTGVIVRGTDIELCEGDKVKNTIGNWIGTIVYENGAFMIKAEHGSWQLSKVRAERLVKIGTIHDNPSLLKGE